MRVNIGPYEEGRQIDVHIDDYDVWNLDQTLALIITPALKKLKDIKHGSPRVDNEDVPEELHRPAGIDGYDIDDNWEARSNYIFDEMIWAFEQTNTYWRKQYESGVLDLKFEPLPNGGSTMMRGPNYTFEIDRDGVEKHQDRINNGLRLFAKYYHSLWD